MRPRKRDPAFLHMAAVAALGGALAITFSIGFPIWTFRHGHAYTPAFSLFAAWGIAALAGAYACLRTYYLSDDPHQPPRGGVRLALAERTGAPFDRAQTGESHRRAA